MPASSGAAAGRSGHDCNTASSHTRSSRAYRMACQSCSEGCHSGYWCARPSRRPRISCQFVDSLLNLWLLVSCTLEQILLCLARSAWCWATVKGELTRGMIVGLCPSMNFHSSVTVPHIATGAASACPTGLWARAGTESHEQHEQHQCASSTPHNLHPFRRENDHNPQEETAEQDQYGSCGEAHATQQPRTPLEGQRQEDPSEPHTDEEHQSPDVHPYAQHRAKRYGQDDQRQQLQDQCTPIHAAEPIDRLARPRSARQTEEHEQGRGGRGA